MPVALNPRGSDERPKRAEVLAGLNRPVETVVLARRAAQPLGVFEHSVPVAIPAGILALGLDIGVANSNGPDFVHAYAAVKDLLRASLRIKEPLPIVLDKRDGEWPAI